jgi:hypothetical protein
MFHNNGDQQKTKHDYQNFVERVKRFFVACIIGFHTYLFKGLVQIRHGEEPHELLSIHGQAPTWWGYSGLAFDIHARSAETQCYYVSYLH